MDSRHWLAFKPNTDDMRRAGSIKVITRLLAHGLKVRADDPAAMNNARKVLPPAVAYCDSPYEAVVGADAVALVTECDFKFLNLERHAASRCIDGRNLREPDHLGRIGFEYHSIGRRPVTPA